MNSRQKDDWYPTPDEATIALLDAEQFDGPIWEPAAGDGALAFVLETRGYKTICSDLNEYGYCQHGIDFLMERKKEADTLITNPPYKLATDFVNHAINLGVKKHAWLLRLAFLEGAKRYDALHSHTMPVRIHVFKKRLTIWRGDEERPWYGSGKTAYAWFVYEQGATTTNVHHI